MLVTGGAGHIGARVLAALSDVGWRTRALVHRTAVAGADETITGDLLDPESLVAAVNGVDAVLHLAAVTHARRAASYDVINVGGTGALVAASEAAGVSRLVYVSTRAIGEDAGAYGRSKANAERIVAAGRVAFTIVRLPEVYGAGGSEGIDQVLDRARRGGIIPVVGRGDDEVRPIHVDDAVAALIAALASDRTVGRTYTLAGESLNLGELARQSADAAGAGARVIYLPVRLVAALSEASRVLPLPLYPDQLARLTATKPPPSDDAAADLGFTPRPLDLRTALRP